jgi:hypothetical protein
MPAEDAVVAAKVAVAEGDKRHTPFSCGGQDKVYNGIPDYRKL